MVALKTGMSSVKTLGQMHAAFLWEMSAYVEHEPLVRVTPAPPDVNSHPSHEAVVSEEGSVIWCNATGAAARTFLKECLTLPFCRAVLPTSLSQSSLVLVWCTGVLWIQISSWNQEGPCWNLCVSNPIPTLCSISQATMPPLLQQDSGDWFPWEGKQQNL